MKIQANFRALLSQFYMLVICEYRIPNIQVIISPSESYSQDVQLLSVNVVQLLSVNQPMAHDAMNTFTKHFIIFINAIDLVL